MKPMICIVNQMRVVGTSDLPLFLEKIMKGFKL